MAEPLIPTITKRAPTIDFIDRRLPKYHPVFATQAAQYDPLAKQFIPSSHAMGPNNSSSLANQAMTNVKYSSISNVQRPEWKDANAMTFWNSVFPESMSRLQCTPEPKGRSKTYDIRDKADWDSVYETLELARQKYQTAGGLVGKIRKVRRKGADSITPGVEAAKIASKVVPQDNIATPVVGAVVVVLDALKVSAAIRNQVLSGFDDLDVIFSDVELFLATVFQGDPNIYSASMDLIVTTLAAIEKAIGLFTSSEWARGGRALFSGTDYQKELRDSIEMIQTKSGNLLQQAERSHMFESHWSGMEIRKQQAQILSKVEVAVSATNSINDLMIDHLKEKERLKQMERELDAARQENIFLRVENGFLRSTSPFSHQQQIQDDVTTWYVDQSTLRHMIDTFDLDFTDGAFISDKKEQIPSKDKSRAEQIVNTPLFRNWIVSASSARLLVHWGSRVPKVVAQVSPLSVFCMTLAGSLRARDEFISAIWFCGEHIDVTEPSARTHGQIMLSSLIDQLLRQFQFDTRPLSKEIDLEGLQAGSVAVLSELLRTLVRQLPPSMTLFVVVDGVAFYERDGFESDEWQALLTLVRLVTDANMMTPVKLLFTSTLNTDFVRAAFEQDDLILTVDSLPVTAVMSEERIIRELGELEGT